ncbi:hypothetical protein ACIQGZ_17070 [Streptomyces sp. NPDC092296]|uniref:hypothetical protein n=1 Tax=Streptomyces sp. NPDC092296 TaxID=3366012 RepID=UPI0037F6B646
MNRIAWWLALAIIAPAAAGITAWSLFVVAHDHYGVPAPLAALVAAVFDGTALACLYLASQAAKEGRSAAAPRLATLALATVSVYLNLVHARLIHGGVAAGLLFAAPTAALLLLADLSWSTTRSQKRAERGESPMRLPAFGAWGWLLAREEAAASVRRQAVAHVTGQQPAPAPARDRTARAVLTQRFAAMDPAEAIRITADAHPHLDPAGIANLLADYGITVDALAVALILGTTPPQVSVQRDDTPKPPGGRPAISPEQTPALAPPRHTGHRDTDPATAGQAPIPDPLTRAAAPTLAKADAVRAAITALGADATARQIAEHVTARYSLPTDAGYVRTIRARDKRKTTLPAEPHLPGTGQYL